FALPQIASLIGALGAAFGAFPGTTSSGMPGSTGAGTGTYWGMNFTPGAYRFLNVTGYAGRVGEYDALEQSLGANLEGDYVSMPHRLSILTRGTVVNRSDFDLASQINLGEWLEAGASMRSFMEQQDNYPFYAGVISPDIETSLGIPDGTVFGVKRRMGEASAKVKLPGLPIRLFIKGGWQTRVGQNQLTFLDENTNSNCGETCHFSSKFQPLNYTTRNIGGGMEVNLGGMSLIYEHDFSSFNDRLAFPSANFGPMLNEAEPGPVFVPDTPAGAYYLDIPAPSHYSSDMLSLNWTLSPELMLNGRAAYRRMRDVFTHNPQSSLDSDITLGWHPLERVRITADFHQQNLVNNFVPYFALFGNMSYHEHRAGLSAEYEMSRHLDLEARYKRSGITRSNAFLWPQVYSFDNTDPQYVVPSSFGNTTGLTLRYHGGDRWSTRAGYEWTGTHAPGYVTVPKSNNRIFGNVTLTPAHWLALTNDLSVIVQNAFPVIQRRNRFYVETASATLVPAQDWMIDLGYSYQQNNLGTYMAFQNDSAAGYVVDEPFVPYRQLSQSYWIRSTYKFGQRLELNLGLSHNSAHSGMRPDVNPNDYLLLGNGSLPPESFDPVVFQQALGGLSLGSTLGSQVNVPQLIGQGKLSYLLPHGFDAGFLLYYGSYRDYTNPNLNGILRAYSIYLGRSW
ncbi:MAG TPA: hypothetical protein VE398_22715, partial [Acidobacteriota bacterium]|nr:hypothetical protein [Acidobacteriota bacterium]